jgi:NADH-quinone oxidoreductase subunit K
MNPIASSEGLLFAVVLFGLGVVGLLVRRNVIFMLISVEIMLNAAGLSFIVAGAAWNDPAGQILFILVITIAAAEVAVGLALILKLHQQRRTVDGDSIDLMRG